MLVSIIVPVYNVEEFLPKCVNSIISQTYKDIEVILVNDGSNDSSGSLCDNFEKEDKRIKVIHKENGGLSDARNLGVYSSCGNYLMFIDSDDYLKDNYVIEKLVSKVYDNPVDFILFRFEKYYEINETYFKEKKFPLINTTNCSDVLYELSKGGFFPIAACSKFIKRELAEKVSFKKGYLSEDIDWFVRIAMLSRSCICTNEIFYVYRQRSGSISYNAGIKSISDIIELIEVNKKVIELSKVDYKLKKALLSGLAYEYTIIIGLFSLLSEVDKIQDEIIFNRIKEMKDILQYDLNIKVKIVKISLWIFGLKKTMKLLGHKINNIKGK